MNAQRITETYSVSGQIGEEDIGNIAEAGYRIVICNRPDGEDHGQPSAADIERACLEHGLAFHHLPFQGANLSFELVESFRGVLDGADGPVLAYCRSGQRCTYLWFNARR
jgi:uncharacterized protein (TIGR01244 family)